MNSDPVFAKMTMERDASALRRMAAELELIAPAESMYLCSIAQRLEIKASKLSSQ